MPHQLDFIKKEHVLQALSLIDKNDVPKNNEWSEYWINYQDKLYQFKYAVEIASTFTESQIKTTDFTSNDSSRYYIASLGFHILFKSHKSKEGNPSFWVGASYYGLPGNQIDKFDDFISSKYWRTDHYLDQGEGVKIFETLKTVRVNDRICIRYFDKKGSSVQIAAMGTISNTTSINDGQLEVIWDYNPPLYSGPKPKGPGSGNWWKTLFQLKNPADIATIFGHQVVEKRISRLAWNEHGWVMPSGPYGKSDHPDTHEAQEGYGHEEWLFDTGKVIDGFHYGFLEPVRKEHNAYVNKTFDLWLYAIHGESKKLYWIGEIQNATVITKEDSAAARKIYKEKGWLEEMEAQIKACGASEKGFSNWPDVDLFNIKFKASDILINDPYFELSEKHPVNSLSRYHFAHFKDEYEVETDEIDSFNFDNESEDKEDDSDGPEKRTHYREPRPVQITYLHKAISLSLTKMLKQRHGSKNVKREYSAGYGANRIDIVVSLQQSLTFYEIKTYNCLRTSVREALGQLTEYCYYPNKKKAVELVIVTQLPATNQIKTYFQHLRTTFNFSIYYQSYDLETKILSEKY